jgi:universal stress protein E
MDHILAATDLSPRSDVAVRRALFLAARLGARASVLHVVDDDEPTALVSGQLRASADHLRHFVEETQIPGLEVDVLVKAGDPFRVINEIAVELGVKLIVMGAHRKNLFLDMFRGTTIERVLRTGRTPILLARKPVEEPIDSVVVGVEPDEICGAAIALADRLGLFEEASITLVRAYADPTKLQMVYAGVDQDAIRRNTALEEQRHIGEIHQFLRGTALADRNYRLILQESEPSQLLVQVAGDLGADLIVMGTRSLAGIRKVVVGSVVEGVLRQAPCDILAVPALQ